MPAGTVLFSSRAPIGYVAIAAQRRFDQSGVQVHRPLRVRLLRVHRLGDAGVRAGNREQRVGATTFKEVSGRIVAGVPFPLPPLAEQHRIVAKVDELVALCDRLEETRTAREDTRDRLTKASLVRLTAPNTDAADVSGPRTVCHPCPSRADRPRRSGQAPAPDDPQPRRAGEAG